MAKRLECAAIAVQEHEVAERSQGSTRATVFQRGFDMVMAPLDETGHAGVGVMVRRTGRCQELAYASEEAMQARQQGRFLMARADAAAILETVVMSADAWSGAAEQAGLLERTNALIRATRIEIGVLRGQPVLRSIDLNGEPADFSEMLEAVGSGELWDMGNTPHWDLEGDGTAHLTCRAHGLRRDA